MKDGKRAPHRNTEVAAQWPNEGKMTFSAQKRERRSGGLMSREWDFAPRCWPGETRVWGVEERTRLAVQKMDRSVHGSNRTAGKQRCDHIAFQVRTPPHITRIRACNTRRLPVGEISSGGKESNGLQSCQSQRDERQRGDDDDWCASAVSGCSCAGECPMGRDGTERDPETWQQLGRGGRGSEKGRVA